MVCERRPHLRVRLSMLILFVRFTLGILVATFFRSMAALLNPIHGGTEGIKWRLVTYTAVMFSFATVFTVISLIRRTPYLSRLPLLETLPLLVLPDLMFLLNYWLADGLLVSSLFNAASIRPSV